MQAAPFIKAVSRSFLSTLLHDDVTAFNGWCDKVEQEPPCLVAKKILSRIHWITDVVWKFLLTRVANGSRQLRSALLQSCARLVHRSRTDEGLWEDGTNTGLQLSAVRWSELWETMQKSDVSDLSDVIYPVHIRNFLATVSDALTATRGKEDFDDDSIVQASQMIQSRCRTSFSELFVCGQSLACLKKMHDFGKSFYALSITENHKKLMAMMREHVEEHDMRSIPWAGFLFVWLKSVLSDAINDDSDRYFFFRCNLLALTAAAAEMQRDVFRRQAISDEDDQEEFELLLSEAAQSHDAFPGRAAAIRLLGFLQAGTNHTIQAFKSGLRDYFEVQRAVMDAVTCLRRIDDSALSDILELLYDGSAVTAYATAQLLVTLGQHPKTHPNTRAQIIDGLAKAARDPRSRRIVQFHYVEARIPEMPQLDDCFVTALQKIYQLG